MDFVEDVIAHSNSCIIDEDDHTDDWDCIHELFYQAYVNFMMPMIVNEYDNYGPCGGRVYSHLSRYTKELCTTPCTVQRDGFYYSFLQQCGSSTACCVSWSTWCRNEDGTVESSYYDKYQVNECSLETVENPCPKIINNP